MQVIMRKIQDFFSFEIGDPEQREKERKKHLAYISHLEAQLDKESQLGFQRHFVSTGRRIRRAASKVVQQN